MGLKLTKLFKCQHCGSHPCENRFLQVKILGWNFAIANAHLSLIKRALIVAGNWSCRESVVINC